MGMTLTSDCIWQGTHKGHGQSYYSRHGIFGSRTDMTTMEEMVEITLVCNLLTDEKIFAFTLRQESALMV